MGKLIVWNIASVDGYFEGTEPWDLSMHETVWGDELEALSIAQQEDAEGLIFGRRTYEGMAAHWTRQTGTIADAMNSLPKYVVSDTLTEADWNNTKIISGDIVSAIADLKRAATRNFYVFGSADLLSTLLAAGIVDEYRLGIAPLLLGRGNLLFKPSDERIDLKLLKSQPLMNGGIVLYYGVENASA
ncbi:dihydrofolate reductase family protein [Pelagibacterium sp. 26DY04]|uniref:dihydrofolate reductase family protein n=1 Tax=Pelagibacterium sp. 26DY04 TaxID=2967130 RepID=UPI002815F5B8|nr:dihydrofolate reductase family protein [Pelagibacterium sp. 26DY04]WMT85774.1 dihydrofolate reductase family protein [Pelagibacterium sp. 26DY04]